MALEAVVFPQYTFTYSTLSVGDGPHWNSEYSLQDQNLKLLSSKCESPSRDGHIWNVTSSSPPQPTAGAADFTVQPAGSSKKKRRRLKSCKDTATAESQRMIHIAVERNRRRQMNHYLSVLRSIMPSSYVQKGDQASIVGGAINYVKELEHLLQSLEANKRSGETPFAGFFTLPQYSSCDNSNNMQKAVAADIEVSMVETHASLKVLSRRRPRQLLLMVAGLQSLRLTTLHLNVATIDDMVLYSFSLKVEEDCRLVSVDKIAKAVYQMMLRIRDEAGH